MIYYPGGKTDNGYLRKQRGQEKHTGRPRKRLPKLVLSVDCVQWRIQGGANPAMAPHRSWQWSLAPLGGRKSNGSVANLSKCKDFGLPRIDVGYGFGSPTEK